MFMFLFVLASYNDVIYNFLYTKYENNTRGYRICSKRIRTVRLNLVLNMKENREWM